MDKNRPQEDLFTVAAPSRCENLATSKTQLEAAATYFPTSSPSIAEWWRLQPEHGGFPGLTVFLPIARAQWSVFLWLNDPYKA
jgi:hypothetical protein